MINLMSLSAETTEVVSDRVNVAGNWGLIGSTVVTGIVIVFLILAILIFFLWAMGKIFQSIENSKNKKKEQKVVQPVAPVPAAQPVVEEIYEDEDDDEIIAVISAAIAAYSESDGKQYRICGIKKREKSQRSAWNAAGISENMRGF